MHTGCGKAFRKHQHLKVHEFDHTQVNPFVYVNFIVSKCSQAYFVKKINCFDIYFMVLWKKFVMGFMHKKWFKENVNVNVLVLRLSQEFFSDHYLLKKLLLTVIWKLTDLIDLPWNRCPVEGCGMSFRFPSVLKRHSKVHEGKCQTIWW